MSLVLNYVLRVRSAPSREQAEKINHVIKDYIMFSFISSPLLSKPVRYILSSLFYKSKPRLRHDK